MIFTRTFSQRLVGLGIVYLNRNYKEFGFEKIEDFCVFSIKQGGKVFSGIFDFICGSRV